MPTKLLLIEDVDHVGRSGDIVSVKPGYARNCLLPKRLAVICDKAALKRQAALKEARLQRAAEDKKEAEEQAKKLEGVTITAVKKIDPEGHLYGSVSAAEILKLIGEQAGIPLDKKAVQLKQPIKKLGSHAIDLRLKEGVEASITLKVLSEEEAEEQQAEVKE